MLKLKNIFVLLFLFIVAVLTAEESADTLQLQKQKEAFGKYLKLSKDEQFQLSERELFAKKALDIAQRLQTRTRWDFSCKSATRCNRAAAMG